MMLTFRTRASLLSLAALGTLLAGCQSKPVSQTACVDFEPPLAPGTQFGAAAGHSSGAKIFSANGIVVRLQEFENPGSDKSFNVAYIDSRHVPGGSGQSLRTNNINVSFDFSDLPFDPTSVQLKYLDMGGTDNLAVNGGDLRVGRLQSAPTTIDDVSVVVASEPAADGESGAISLAGPIQSLTIGGQELWIDQVCAAQ
jgi:hypothetical protein